MGVLAAVAWWRVAAAAAAAAFTPTALFGDHMVLQASARGAQLNGLTAPGARVTLTITPPLKSGGEFSAAADSSGEWKIDKLAAAMNEGPYTLTLSSMGISYVAADVWFGLVLLCTGQSNMELNFHPICKQRTALFARTYPPVAEEVRILTRRRNSAIPDNNDTLIASATTPEIRLFKVPVPTGLHETPLLPGTPLGGWGRNSSSDPDAATGGMNWTLTSPATIPEFSAICYLTAKEISQRVMCEMGCERGHTPNEARWLPMQPCLPGAVSQLLRCALCLPVRKQQCLPHGLDPIVPRLDRRAVVDVGGNARGGATDLLGGGRRAPASQASGVALQCAEQ